MLKCLCPLFLVPLVQNVPVIESVACFSADLVNALFMCDKLKNTCFRTVLCLTFDQRSNIWCFSMVLYFAACLLRLMFCFVIILQDSAVNSHCLEAVCRLTDLCCLDWGVVTGPHLSIQFTDFRSHSKGVYSRDEPLLPIAPHLCSNLRSEFNIQKDSNGNPILSLNELHRILSKRLPLTDIRVFRIPVTSASRFYFTA